MEQRGEEIGIALGAHGLSILGFFPTDEDDVILPDENKQPETIVIVGNAGSSIWPAFSKARRSSPDLTLDAWTTTIVDGIAARFEAKALYPFEGPPFWPFTQWAIRTGNLFPSPIGLTIHPVHGLWHAFRAALLFDSDPGFSAIRAESPCDSCIERPCLTTCPVSAFSADGYDFERCLDYLGAGKNSCRATGCEARKACPIGKDHHYQPEHAAFHMGQLLKAHGKP